MTKRVAMKVDATNYYLSGDHLGSTSVLADNQGIPWFVRHCPYSRFSQQCISTAPFSAIHAPIVDLSLPSSPGPCEFAPYPPLCYYRLRFARSAGESRFCRSRCAGIQRVLQPGPIELLVTWQFPFVLYQPRCAEKCTLFLSRTVPCPPKFSLRHILRGG
jgi:hypothetical protein